MKVQKIHHVSVLVKDLEKAGKLYSDLFGIEFDGPYEQKDLDVRFLSSSIGLNLASPLTPDGPTARSLERRGEGLSMLVFNVPNLDTALVDMQSHGIRVVGREDRPKERVASLHPKDLCGVMVELWED
ncbi:MAG: VOC family protein [Candidatus Tectomicrobia bacterium]|uniref:VOC family protein n=1 Tax=Tectimicrobiota bacterium TaxID=2528274 RepID=A0A933GM11_UNCTE|nr:VOC family protein [Candidatus Tectomicrobia bacterium]